MTIERKLIGLAKGSIQQVDFTSSVYTSVATTQYLATCWTTDYAWCLYEDATRTYLTSLIYNPISKTFSVNATYSNIPTTLSVGSYQSGILPLQGNKVFAGTASSQGLFSATTGSVSLVSSMLADSIMLEDYLYYNQANNYIIAVGDTTFGGGWAPRVVKYDTNTALTSLAVSSAANLQSTTSDTWPTATAQFDSDYYLSIHRSDLRVLLLYPNSVVSRNTSNSNSYNLAACNADTNRIVISYDGNLAIATRSGSSVSYSVHSTSLPALKINNDFSAHCVALVKIKTNLLALLYLTASNTLIMRTLTVNSSSSLTLGTSETLANNVSLGQVRGAYNSTLKVLLVYYSSGLIALGRTWMN